VIGSEMTKFLRTGHTAVSYGAISFSLTGELEIPFIMLAVLQFPVYGFLIDKAINTQKIMLLITGFHMGLALIILLTAKDL
jgi:hypothetical protein